MYKTYKMHGLALKYRGCICTIDALANREIEAVQTFPPEAVPARARLVNLIKHTLKASYDKITDMLDPAREDKGRPLVVHYVLTVPAGWDELAKAVMRRAAVQAGSCDVFGDVLEKGSHAHII